MENTIQTNQEEGFERTKKKTNRMSMNDEIFMESINILSNKRHLLTKEQEDFINQLASNVKYLG